MEIHTPTNLHENKVAALILKCTQRIAETLLTHKLICYEYLLIGNKVCRHLKFLQW